MLIYRDGRVFVTCLISGNTGQAIVEGENWRSII